MSRGSVCSRNVEHRPQKLHSLTPSTIASADDGSSRNSSAPELVERLTARVKELEATLREFQSMRQAASLSPVERSQDGDAAAARISPVQSAELSPPSSEQSDPVTITEASPSRTLVNSEIENAATILEFLAWGRRKDPDYNEVVNKEDNSVGLNQSPGDVGPGTAWEEWSSEENSFLSGSKTSSLRFLQFLLPSRRQLTQIINYHRECLLWYHGVFHSLVFAAEVDDFLTRHNGCVENPDVDLQWIAMLFAVLTGSMACAPRPVAHSWGFKEAEQITLANRWFEATTVCLNIADYTARHSIYSVQAIAVLTIPAHLLGHSNRQSVLLASAVRVAQNLGLHRLGEEMEEESPDLVKRELGRRVWWQLCTQDWFSIPFSESYLIHSTCFDTGKPRNCYEEDMRSLPDDIPTIMSYSRFFYKVAAVMPQLQDGLTSSNTLYTKYEQVLQSDTQMRALATQHVPHYIRSVPLDDRWPCHVPWARKSVAISLSHKIIMIHRKFLGLSFSNPAFQFTRKTCVAASKTIIKEQKQMVKDNGPVLWIYHAFSVAAGIILCLDILHRSPSDKEYIEHRILVEDVIDVLSRFEISMIAKRGIVILRALLTKERTERVRKLDIPELIQSFCEQERRSPSRRQTGRNLQPGWPPSAPDANSTNGQEASESLDNLGIMSTASMPVTSTASNSAHSVPLGAHSFGHRHSGEESFPDLMALQFADFTTTSHSLEDILFLAQNYRG
ncbi:hypothetical protein MAP00_005826 [Monascus purpureus]|nr:hypothetical protein MAP00_005826 [Monascus purpureus]